MSQNRSQHESYLLGVLRAAFPEARIREGFEDKTLYAVTFYDGTTCDLTLHIDEDEEDESEDDE